MRFVGVLLLVGCSGSDFMAPAVPPELGDAGMGGELAAETGGAGGTTGGSGGGTGDAGTGGRAGSSHAGSGGATTAGATGDGGSAGAPTAGSGGATAGMSGSGGAGDAGSSPGGAGAGGGAGPTGGAGTGAGGATTASGGAGSSAGMGGKAGTAGAPPSLEPQPAENCPGFFDYYVPVGTCIWLQGEWEMETPECDLVVPDERTGCATAEALELGPQTVRLKPGDPLVVTRFDLEDGSCPKVCSAP